MVPVRSMWSTTAWAMARGAIFMALAPAMAKEEA